jgi:hypothetical protein
MPLPELSRKHLGLIYLRYLLLLLLISSNSKQIFAATAPPFLGTHDRLMNLLDISQSRCRHVLGSVGGGAGAPEQVVVQRLTRGLVDVQMKFASEFLQYPENDLEQGVKHAIISYFPSSRALFTDAPIAAEKVNPATSSYQLRKKGHREADRTLQSIVLLQKIIAGESPEAFVTPIAPLNPSQADITAIRQIVLDYLTDIPNVPLDDKVFAKVKVEKLHAMIVRLIFHDQGKFKSVMEEYQARMKEKLGHDVPLSADHDGIMHEVLREHAATMAPEYLGVFDREKASMAQTDQLAINPGRFFQFEAPAHHILGLAKLDSEAFQFWLIKEILDVGGAKADVHPVGSFWIKPVIANYFKLHEDRQSLQNVSEEAIVRYYNSMLAASAKKMKLSTETSHDKAVAKLSLLFRLDQIPQAYDGTANLNPQQRRIQSLEKEFAKLPEKDRALLTTELTRLGVGDGVAYTFGYIPEMATQIGIKLGVAAQKTADAEMAITDDQIDKSNAASLAMFVKALKLTQYHMSDDASIKGKTSGEFTLEMNKVSDFVKANGVEAALNAPLLFKKADSNSAEISIAP